MTDHLTDYDTTPGIDRDLRPGDRVVTTREILTSAVPWSLPIYDARPEHSGVSAMVVDVIYDPIPLVRLVTESIPLRFGTVLPSEVQWIEEVGRFGTVLPSEVQWIEEEGR